MKTLCSLGSVVAVAALLAACGGDHVLGNGEGGGATGSCGDAASTGSAGAGADGGGAPPVGILCDEVDVGPVSCLPKYYRDPLVSFVALSGLIVRGTVTALHATTAGVDLPDKSRAIIVQVDAVLFDGGGIDVTGQEITVQLLAAPTMAVGYEGYFFAQVWTIGQSVGVTEVVHIDPGVYPTIESDVPAIEALLDDERLYARMQTAGAVLVGTVTAVTPLPAMGPVSEHNPIWAEATITADCALRGATLQTAKVAFATSNDVAWSDSPKLTIGEKGIFLLQPVPSPPDTWKVPEGIPYVVTDVLDVMPPDERAHVAALVLCPPSH